jgi:hypothetical protein
VDADQPAEVLALQDQVEREVAEGHRHDGVERVGVAAAHQVAEALVDDVDAPAALYRARALELRRHLVADAAELAVAVLIGSRPLERHLLLRAACVAPSETARPSTGWGAVAVVDQQLGQRSMSNGCSGMTQRSAAPAIVGSSA